MPCLRSRIVFTFADEVCSTQSDMTVQVEPPVGRRGRKSRRSLATNARSTSPLLSPNEDEDGRSVATQSDDGTDQANETSIAVKGWFRSTNSVTVRWARSDAGKINSKDEMPALLCDEAESSVTVRFSASAEASHLAQDLASVSPFERKIQLDYTLSLQLRGLHCPGLGQLVYFPLMLDSFSQNAECLHLSVDRCDDLHDWHLSNRKDGRRGGTPVADMSRKKAKLQGFSEARNDPAALDGPAESAERESDSEDLFDVRPPRGINLDASMEGSDLYTAGSFSRNSASPYHATDLQGDGTSLSSGHELSPEVSDKNIVSTKFNPARQQVILYFTSAAAYRTGKSDILHVTIRCRLLVSARRADEFSPSWKPLQIPLWSAPTAGSQHCSWRAEPALSPAVTDELIPSTSEVAPLSSNVTGILEADFSSLGTLFLHVLAKSPAHFPEELQRVSAGDIMAKERIKISRASAMTPSLSAPLPQLRNGSGFSSSSMVRPRPIYDAITLQHNDDDSAKPSVIADASIRLSVISPRTSTRLSGHVECRLLCEVSLEWPFISNNDLEAEARSDHACRSPIESQPLQGSSIERLLQPYSDVQPEEVDVWLSRSKEEPHPVVRKVFLDGRPISFTQSDAGDSVCIHIRRSTPHRNRHELSVFEATRDGSYDGSAPDRSNLRSAHCGRLSILVDYPHLSWSAGSPEAANGEERAALALQRLKSEHPRSSWPFLPGRRRVTAEHSPPRLLQLSLPIPIFAQEILSLSVDVCISDDVGRTGGERHELKVMPSGFDICEAGRRDYMEGVRSNATSHTHLRKFMLPSLTPLDVTLDAVRVTDGTQVKRDRRSPTHRLPWYAPFLALLLVLVALNIHLQLEIQEQLAVQIDSLRHRVDQLAMATDVDFRDGTWTGADAPGSGTLQDILSEVRVETPKSDTPRLTPTSYTPASPTAALQPYQPLATTLRIPSPSTLLTWPLLILRRGFARAYMLLFLRP